MISHRHIITLFHVLFCDIRAVSKNGIFLYANVIHYESLDDKPILLCIQYTYSIL